MSLVFGGPSECVPSGGGHFYRTEGPGQGHHVGTCKFSHPTPDLPNQTFWGLCLFKPPRDSEAREV